MSGMKKLWLNFLFLALTLGVNALGAFGYINGLSQKVVSDRYPTLITPAPFTFSIWGLIYGLVALGLVVLLLRRNERYYQRVDESISPLFWASCLFNMAWIVAFSFEQLLLAELFIFGLVITLALICRQLLALRENGRWLLPLAFGLYCGWLVIATVVNTAALLVQRGWSAFGLAPHWWAVMMLLLSVVLVGGIVLSLKNAALPLPLVGAYIGIWVAQAGTTGAGGLWVRAATLLGAAGLLALAVFTFLRNQNALLPKANGI